MLDKDLDAVLKQAFEASTRIYKERGFQRRIGFGRKPALISVDLANAWTRPGNPFSCENVDEEIIPGMQRLATTAGAPSFPYILPRRSPAPSAFSPSTRCSSFAAP